jgi:VCBS repeat-containing protein
VGAGNLTIAGALATGGVATFAIPRHVGIYAAGNESARTFTITGTDRTGKTMTEAITGPNATTVYGAKNFKTVTQVAVDAATAGDVEVGDGNKLESQWIPVEYRIANSYMTEISYPAAAQMTASVQYTRQNPFSSTFDEHDASPVDDDPSNIPCRAVRMKITNHVSGTPTLTVVCS